MEMEQGKGQFLVYQAEDGKLKLDVRFEDESVWLTQQLMADLFQTTKQNISLHIQNIYEEGELVPEATVKKYLTVRSEGNREVKRLQDYYNLDMIISVGYRIKSHVATHFRIWPHSTIWSNNILFLPKVRPCGAFPSQVNTLATLIKLLNKSKPRRRKEARSENTIRSESGLPETGYRIHCRRV